VAWERLGPAELLARVHVTAAPVDGAANEEVLRLLSKSLGLAPSRLSIVRGDHGRQKTVEAAVDPAEFDRLVEALLQGR